MIMFDRALREALAAMGWSLGLLAAGVVQQVAAFDALSSNWGEVMDSLGVHFAGTPLGGQVTAFALALVGLHLAFGLLCWGMARCTLRAVPGWNAMRWRVLFGWLSVGTLWLLLANGTLYPWSETGIHGRWLESPLFAGVRVFDFATVVLVIAVAVVLWRALASHPRMRGKMPRVALYGVLLIVVAGAARMMVHGAGNTPAVTAKPNIILIGVDSLRNDAVGEGRGIGVTPNIDAFLRDDTHRFMAATTPLARTFPAWVSILTGRYPRHNGAREDLMARDMLQPVPTLAQLAKRAGYHTVWATDEVRFANIDESYGFDRRITPTIGVADFLLGKANDFPLSNLFANTRLARWWFPEIYANRAAAHVYRPQTFVERLDAEFEPEGPTLLALHLTLPHHPFHWAEPTDRVFDRDTDSAYRYLNCVIAADAQFGGVLAVLERKGVLGNALVVLLSDHGEALGVPAADALLHGREVLELMDGNRIALHGHGSSVFSPNQFKVVLAMRGYGALALPTGAREHAQPVSLVDIAPTVADLAGLPADRGFDGASLRSLLAADAAGSTPLADRVQFTETGFRTPLLAREQVDEAGLLGQAAPFFRMNPATARLEVRPELMSRLIADKERAAFSRDWLLGAMPTPGGPQSHIYVFVGRHGQAPRRVTVEPPDDGSELRRLWVAMHEHYGEELPGLPANQSPASRTAKR
jgi:arylsulfatase A-like enzyme